MAIDIGAACIDRSSTFTFPVTLIGKDTPANASGIITTVEIWSITFYDLVNCIVGTFYTTNGNTLKCRDSATIGAVVGGAKRTFTQDSGSNPLAITVVESDYIGIYATAGRIERHASGYAGLWYIAAEHIDPGDEATYSFAVGDAISLHGIGEEAAVFIPTIAII